MPSSFLKNFAAASASLIVLASAQQPEQVHIAMTGIPGQLSIDFMAHENCTLNYGAQIDVTPDFSSADFVPVYNCFDFSTQESIPTWANQVLLKNLKVGTKYYYVVGAENSRDPWSQVMSFTYGSGLLRPQGYTYAVLADFGYFNAESLEMLIAECFEGKFDGILHAGDFAYDLDSMKGAVGDGYFRQLMPVISSVPYNGIPGNHESAQNYTHYKTRFASVADNAGVNSGSGTAMFYSFNEGLAHFIFWDSEAYWSQPVDSQTAMVNWMKADLVAANNNRATVPWVIGFAHKAWWMDTTIAPPTGAGSIVWQILEEGGVDFHVVGHIHYYARDLSQYPNAANGTGVVDRDCASANLGNATNPSAIYTDCKYMTTIVCAAPGDQEVNAEHHETLTAPQESVTSTNNYGYSYLTITNATHLHWTFTTAVPHVNSTAPGYTDELWYVVNNHGPRTNLPPV